MNNTAWARRRVRAVAVCAALCALNTVPSRAQDGGDVAPLQPQTPLPWAYALNPPGFVVPIEPTRRYSVPGSEQQFLGSEIRDLYNPPDWHPADHPPMPEIVASGRNPGVYACGYCHLPNGQGRPENASLAGLSADYIRQQMDDYRNGRRRSSEPQMGPPANMLAIGINATPEEVEAAAAYFSSLAPQRWIRVVETDTVPVSEVAGWMFVPVEGGGTEPIGNRILEMPEDFERTELRDSRSGFVAYVPPGSVERGRELVTTGGDGKTQVCTVCHGSDLRGLGPVPQLAGRSPSYLVRQLYDLKIGSRNGTWAPLMEAAVANLETADMVAIAAYLASLEP